MQSENRDWKNALLIVWAILSFVYISMNLYQGFKTTVMQNAYMTGKSETINAIIEQASNKECKAFNVYSGEKKVDLVNVACLQQAANQPAEPAGSTAPTGPAPMAPSAPVADPAK